MNLLTVQQISSIFFLQAKFLVDSEWFVFDWMPKLQGPHMTDVLPDGTGTYRIVCGSLRP